MPDDEQQQQTPPINLADPAALTAAYQQYLQYLQQVGNQRPAQAPQVSQAAIEANAPTSLLGTIGERLAGGPPTDVPMSAAQREAAGNRALFNFSRGLLGTGTFDTIGQALARGETEAERGQYNQEAQIAYGQSAAQDWQRQQMADRLAALKESIPLLQGIQRLNMPSLYGPGGGPGAQAGNTPGTVPDIYSLPKAQFLQAVAQRESGGDPTIMNYVARADPSAIARGATASGKYQMTNETWLEAAKLANIDTTKYPTARSAPEALQDQAASALYDKRGTAPWNPATFKANWVLGKDGKYQLVQGAPYTPPPGQSTATPAQPATAPPAANAAPGTLTEGAPATAAPQGVPLPPGGKPGETAGPAVGIGGALNPATAAQPPDQRAEVTGTGVAGRIPGAYDVASLGPVAPPSSATAPSPAATQPAAEPGWGTVIGGYGRGPAATAPRPQPPPGVVTPAPQQPPAQQPPAQPAPQQPPATPPAPDFKSRNADGSFVLPDDRVSLPEYQERTRHIYSPQELAQRGVTVPANSTAIQTAYTNIQSAERDGNAARQAAQDLYIRGQDPSRAMQAANAADAKAADARQEYTRLLQDADEKNGDRLGKLYDAQDAQLATAYDANKQQTQTLANNIRLEEIRGEQARLTNKEQVQNKVNQDTLAQASKDQIDARNLAAQVEGFQSVVENMGQPGWLQTTKNPFGQGESIAEKLGQMGWKVDDTGGYQMMQAGINEMIKSLRAGMPMGSLSDRDLDFIRRMGPNEWMDPDTRMAVTSYILQAARAKQQFSYEIQKELARPNSNAADAIDAADKKVKPFVPTVPAELTAHWTDQSPEWVQQRRQWAADNNIRPGTLYHLSNGDVLIAKRAPQTQAAPARPGPYVPRND